MTDALLRLVSTLAGGVAVLGILLMVWVLCLIERADAGEDGRR